ncbi:MAG: hypothetical protein EPN47_17130 [Acidobacteria bacterium]|nr:MAG: hypothetical protein EPN47_17130 [Acidobacteriota bacterium]
MKVYFNLAVTSDRRERYALAWAVPTLALSAIVLLWFAGLAIRYMQRAHRAQKSLAESQSQGAALSLKEASLRRQIDRPEFRSLVQKTEFVNQLISQRQFSLTDLTFKVSRLLPPSARLNGLALASSSAAKPEVQFAVMGKDEESIETFLNNLEGSNDFSDVLIKSQGFRGGSGRGTQEIALVCTAKYVGLTPASGN